ncbi:MAG: sigma-54 dependent transcriptional regulator [Desulfofustis sp.]|jgi:DNA-binding NtrC family response regulator|nr:sigma-54 dependent transcriptional regulator [Desulfofustis sp.]
MSDSLYILHALSDDTDAHELTAPIAARFASVVQDLAHSDDLISELKKKPYSILFLDCGFPASYTTTQLLQQIKREFTDLITILITDQNEIHPLLPLQENAALFFIAKPIDAAEVTFCVNHCKTLYEYRTRQVRRNNRRQQATVPGFIGNSRIMKDLFDVIERVAEDDFATVLVRGESGTGKELVANAIHARSSRSRHNFVPVNCAAIPDELLESELFGHLKGSFTGAAQNKTGRIHYADNGTLFLDEIGDMKPNLQAKLLRVIQEREFEPVGSLKAIPVNTRIVAATHCNLENLVSEGRFREDLYYRLSVIPLEVPPLRERPEDIPLLLDEFIDRYTSRRGRDKIAFMPETVELLKSFTWRGNVRELENLVQHMSILYSGKRIYPHHLPPKFTEQQGLDRTASYQPRADSVPPISENDISRERAALFGTSAPPTPEINFDNGPINFNELINEFETDLIIKAMRFTSGNKKEASRMLCLKRTTLLEKIKKKEIEGHWER